MRIGRKKNTKMNRGKIAYRKKVTSLDIENGIFPN